MKVEIHPDGTIVIETTPTPPGSAVEQREVDIAGTLTENTAEQIRFGFQPHPTRIEQDDGGDQ